MILTCVHADTTYRGLAEAMKQSDKAVVDRWIELKHGSALMLQQYCMYVDETDVSPGITISQIAHKNQLSACRQISLC